MGDSPLDAAQAAISVSAKAVDTVSLVLDKLEKWKRLREQADAAIRLLYLEVCRDLELLSVLIDDKEKEVGWDDPRVLFFLSRFETSVMEMVLLGSEGEAVYKKLSAKGRVALIPDIVGLREKRSQRYENVLQALRFVFVKVDLLRKLAGEGDHGLLKRVKVIERMKNIEARLLLAKRVLGEMEENKPIA
jgi:hypothetical protein